MRITESQLRRIVRDEARRLSEMGAPAPMGFSYRNKLRKLEDALAILRDVLQDEARIGSEDFDLDNLVENLESYMEAVEVMADQEGTSSFRDPSRQAWKD
jgi:hypothetical protein